MIIRIFVSATGNLFRIHTNYIVSVSNTQKNVLNLLDLKYLDIQVG